MFAHLMPYVFLGLLAIVVPLLLFALVRSLRPAEPDFTLRETPRFRYHTSATFGLMAMMAIIYGCQRIFIIAPPSYSESYALLYTNTLMVLGGLNAERVLEKGEWYRIFTSPFLHFNARHLVSNGVFMLVIGRIIEELLGRAWVIAIFFASALSGSLLSLAMHSGNILSAGASGGLMGLCAALFIISCGLSNRDGVIFICLVLYNIIPGVKRSIGIPTNYADHVGGALGGLLMGAIVWACNASSAMQDAFAGKAFFSSKQLDEFAADEPHYSPPIALSICAIGSITLLWGFWQVALHYSSLAMTIR